MESSSLFLDVIPRRIDSLDLPSDDDLENGGIFFIDSRDFLIVSVVTVPYEYCIIRQKFHRECYSEHEKKME